MFRVLFLISVLFSSNIFAQTQEKPQAYKFDEFGNINEKAWKAKFDKLFLKQRGKCQEGIYIIFYGTKNSVARKYIDYTANRRDCDMEGTRTTFVQGKSQKLSKTEIWIVPAGAKQPMPN